MHWKSISFDWNQARAFLVTAEEGSLSAAARALGMTQPTLGRQVAALEKTLGVTLFERAGKSLLLTPGGHELLEHVRAMGDAANHVSLTASGQSQLIEGTICLSASEAIAAFQLPRMVQAIRTTYPGITVDILASNSVSDLIRREADIAIRNVRPSEPELIAKKIGVGRAFLYATPKYLKSIGSPTSLEELSKAEFIGFDTSDLQIDTLNGLGLQLTKHSFPVVTENQLVQWALVLESVGIGIMLEEVGDNESRVQRLLPQLPAIEFPMWLVAHRELKTSRRVRAVFDLLAEAFAKNPTE